MGGRKRVVVLNDPHAMRINKELAEEIGFQESIVFLQLEYLISISDHEIDGKRWTRQSLEELQGHFPWWSVATIKRIVTRLHERNLIAVDHHNKAGYDRTQWYAIDEEGARDLHSVAILQNEKWNGSDCKMDELNLQNATAQNETTIPKTTEIDKEEGTDVPSKKPKKLKVTDTEAEERWEALLLEDPNADLLREFAAFRTSRNQRGEIKLATLWRQVGEGYVSAAEKLSLEALRYGLSEALRREKPDVRYALAVARNFGFDNRASPSRSIAVIGATDRDYDPEEYRFND